MVLTMNDFLSHHDIYEAALDDSLFQALPERMAREMDVPSAIFFWLHPGDMQEITAGTQPEAHAEYDEFLMNDPWMAQVTADKVGIGAFRLTNYVSADEFGKSEMYNDYVLKNRLDRFWCLGMLQTTRDGLVATAFHKGRRGGDFSDDEQKYVNRHASDLGRLHTIRRELLRNGIRDALAADRSLRDEVPLYELDHEGRLLRMNGLAERLLSLHPRLIVKYDKTLALVGPGGRDFQGKIAGATGRDASKAAAVELPSMRAVDGRLLPAVKLHLLPRHEGGRRVLIIATTDDPAGLRDSFATPEESILLTPRERELLEGLAHGYRRDQLAHSLGVTLPTIDFHGAALRRKLGARTLPEAIATAFRLGLL
uniref:HTH luxR-type domain-containing protein n=2 Tax=Alloyangia mangrovi TaxID=1779329 RepID=A0A2A3JXJ7_9RHOB